MNIYPDVLLAIEEMLKKKALLPDDEFLVDFEVTKDVPYGLPEYLEVVCLSGLEYSFDCYK